MLCLEPMGWGAEVVAHNKTRAVFQGSIGTEDPADIIADLDQALTKALA